MTVDVVNIQISCSKLKNLFAEKDGEANSIVLHRMELCFSSLLWTIVGVPQGSVLTSLLFALFINDLVSSIAYSIEYHMYADDVQQSVYIHGIPDSLSDATYCSNELRSAVS